MERDKYIPPQAIGFEKPESPTPDSYEPQNDYKDANENTPFPMDDNKDISVYEVPTTVDVSGLKHTDLSHLSEEQKKLELTRMGLISSEKAKNPSEEAEKFLIEKGYKKSETREIKTYTAVPTSQGSNLTQGYNLYNLEGINGDVIQVLTSKAENGIEALLALQDDNIENAMTKATRSAIHKKVSKADYYVNGESYCVFLEGSNVGVVFDQENLPGEPFMFEELGGHSALIHLPSLPKSD